MNDALAQELRSALAAGLAFQGLEQIASRLASEQKGLDAVSKRSPDSPQSPRVSRILFITNDGSERFYRDCDVLLNRYAERLLAVRLDIAGQAFGDELFGQPKLCRSVLVADRKACAKALLTLLPA